MSAAIRRFFLSHPLLAGVPGEQLVELAAHATLERVDAGELLFAPDESIATVHWVSSGLVTSRRVATQGRRFIVDDARAGDLVAPQDVLPPATPALDRRTEAAETMVRSHLVVMKRDPFARLVTAHAQVAARLAVQVAERERRIGARFMKRIYWPSSACLAAELVALAEAEGVISADHASAEIHRALHHGELGERLGEPSASVGGYLAALTRRNLYMRRGSITVLPQLAVLRAMSLATA